MKINSTYKAVIDSDNNIEQDYDGPMMEEIESDGTYINDCLEYMRSTNTTRSFRLGIIKIEEITDECNGQIQFEK